VAKDVFMILIKKAGDQALKMNTGRPEALGGGYRRSIGIIKKELNMDFVVSAPENFIEGVKQEILRLNEENKQFKSKIEKLNRKFEECRSS
jgi:hypothetical protein